MAKPTTSLFHLQSLKKKKWLLTILALFSISTLIVLLIRANNSPSCDDRLFYGAKSSNPSILKSSAPSSPLYFMKSKLVLLVSHELSLSGIISFLIYILVFSIMILFVVSDTLRPIKI